MNNKSIHEPYRIFILILALILIAGLALTPTGQGLADSVITRPEAASPEVELNDQDPPTISLDAGYPALRNDSLNTLSSTACTSVFQTGGDRLAALQNDDGGWDWPLDDGNPGSSSPLNTVGPIAMGLTQAYLHTGDPSHLATLGQAGALLLTKTNNFSPSDGYLAAILDQIFGGTTYVDHVTNNFYNPLAAGTYNRNGAGTLYDTAGYVNLIRTARASQGIANLAAWDIGMGLVGAASAGASTTAWIAGLKAEIDELDGSAYYDVIGLAGAVYGLALVGEDYDPTAGEHAAATSLSDIAAILAGYQIDGGGFTWNKNYLNPGEDNETIQETAYALLALNEVNRAAYYSAIQGAANYMLSVQLATGGWKNWAGGGENNEVTGEALWAISIAQPGPVTSNVSANPIPAKVGEPVYFTASVDNTSTGCLNIDSAEYNLDNAGWLPMAAEDGAFDAISEMVTASMLAPNIAGIYNHRLCIRGTDVAGNIGNVECIDFMLVVYDPDGGFVTGGGWIDSPPGAYKLDDYNQPTLVWDQGFEDDTSGWFDTDDLWYGSVTRVASGTGGITSSSGAYHALFEGDPDSAPFTRFDSYRELWTGSWTAEIDVYLDPGWTAGQGFDYSVAASGTDGNHQRDYIFHVTKDTSTGNLYVAGSNNTNFAPREDLENINHYQVISADWYTFQHVFYDSGGALAVDLNLLDSNGNLLFTETRFNSADTIPDEVGGNRYGWFTFINVTDGIAVDDHQLIVPTQPTGRANFGFVSKFQKGADIPTGNTEFAFQAADLYFHSSAYQWLVVNQGGTNAQFKGTGTINGEGEYKFMLWAGDGEPDTFRIRIWEEDEFGLETVIYDNGMDQAIGGGNIVVHTKK